MNADTMTLPTPTFTLEEVAEHLEDWRCRKRRGKCSAFVAQRPHARPIIIPACRIG